MAPSSVLPFLHVIESLKKTKRTGWIRSGVEGPESIGDHMHRMSIMCLLIPESTGLDRSKMTKMAVVHDLAEAIVGDITPQDNVSSKDKHAMERQAMHDMAHKMLGSTPESLEIQALWEEYETAETPEALAVKDIDKFEMIVQAHEYEKTNQLKEPLDSFFESTKGKFKHPIIQGWVQDLYNERAEWLQSRNKS